MNGSVGVVPVPSVAADVAVVSSAEVVAAAVSSPLIASVAVVAAVAVVTPTEVVAFVVAAIVTPVLAIVASVVVPAVAPVATVFAPFLSVVAAIVAPQVVEKKRKGRGGMRNTAIVVGTVLILSDGSECVVAGFDAQGQTHGPGSGGRHRPFGNRLSSWTRTEPIR